MHTGVRPEDRALKNVKGLRFMYIPDPDTSVPNDK
jgi:hypothetical protein